MSRFQMHVMAMLMAGGAIVGCDAPQQSAEKAKGPSAAELLKEANDAVALDRNKADSLRRPTVMGAIGDGDEVKGSFGNGSQYLAWHFTAMSGDVIELDAFGTNGDALDTVLFLYLADDQGRPKARALAYDDDGGEGFASALSFEASVAGGYVAVVRRYDFRAWGEVAVRLNVQKSEPTCTQDADCGEGAFCHPSYDGCDIVETAGICLPTPMACTAHYDPVCGCNGQTYSNSCQAHASGMAVAYEGRCEEVVLGEEGDDCDADDACGEGLVCAGSLHAGTGLCGAEELRATYVGQGGEIPDNDADGLKLTVEVAGLASVPTDIILSLQIKHTWQGDLQVELIDPNGTVAQVWDREGGNAQELTFEGPVTGISMDDEVNGTWTLVVRDLAGFDVGSVESWSLTLGSRWD
ncbi:MAG: proprotein convertase P-domain-containing protein [Bradymonadia bacterium]